MRLGRPVPPIELTPEERTTLRQWARRRNQAQAVALQARLILRCATGETATAIARDVRVTKQTVGKWRTRFVARRLDGLLDEPRPGRHPYDYGCARGARADDHARIDAARRDALVHAEFGAADGNESKRGRAHLAGPCVAAAPHRDLQAVKGSTIHRQGPRHREPVPPSARSRPRAQRG